MRLIGPTLYLDKAEVLKAELTTEKYLWKINNKGQRGWMAITDPANGKNIIVPFESLSEENKAKVEATFGNPYMLLARQPILQMVQADNATQDFFLKYTYDLNGKPTGLSPRQIAQSTRSAAWLQLINKVNDRKGWKEISGSLGLKNVPEFYAHVKDLVELEIKHGKGEWMEKAMIRKVDGSTEEREFMMTYPEDGPLQLPGKFPYSYQNLKEKAAAFAEQGLIACLPLNLGNKGAAKIGKTEAGYDAELADKQASVIRKIKTLHMNLDDSQVNRFATVVFEKNGWPTISDRRVRQILAEQKHVTIPGSQGRRVYKNQIAMQSKRSRPPFPLSYFTLDGWTVELLYQDERGYDNRLVMVVVLDAMCDYPVGYAIGDRETPELIREANRNALKHIQQLFGDCYIPYQVQSDRYGIKTLTPFYLALSQAFTPAAVGNAKSKVIEPWFDKFNERRLHPFYNWSGHNINSSKEHQPNNEMLDLIKKSFPNRDGAVMQLTAALEAERKGKIEKYMAGFAAMPEERKYKIEYLSDRWLTVFGQKIGRTNAITGQGIIKEIAGAEYTFDSFNPEFRALRHLDWQLLIDPADMSKALAISPDGKHRFVLDEKMVVAMGIQDTTPEMRDYRKRIDSFNKTEEQRIIDTYTRDNEVVGEIIRNTPLALDDANEAALKLMFSYTGGQQKERLQDAKRLGAEKKQEQRRIAKETKAEDAAWSAQRSEYLSSKTDFNQYLD